MSAPTPHAMDRVTRSHSNTRLSSVAVESPDIMLDKHKMYTVEWREGATFGFTLTPVNSDQGTVLLLARRTARKEHLEAAGLQDIVPGDLLVMIGGEKVYQLGAENATKYLRTVKKPVRLMMQLSPYGNQDKPLPDLAPNEYHYMWEDGPLGIVLTLDNKSKLPMVKRLSDKANDVVRRDVSISDQLIYANDVPASEYSMDEVMSLLREMPKPVLLRFRKQLQDDHLVELPELAENEYEFLWDYGPLGLVIGMSRSGLPFVRSFTGLGTSRQLGLVQEDDEIVMVNDKNAKEDGFREVMQYLMNVPKPAVLRFRRKIRGSDGRASQLIRESSRESRPAERPSTMMYTRAPVPECVGPLSPVNQLGMSSMSVGGVPQPPPSPQVRVSMDRSRFRSVSSEDEESRGTQTGLSASQAYRGSSTQVVGGRGTVTSVKRVSEGSVIAEEPIQFDDSRSSSSSAGRQTTVSEGRETAILPPDPKNAGRSSIFTFRFDESPPAVAAANRGPARTGPMPPQPDLMSRSQPQQPTRPVAAYQDTAELVAEPTPTLVAVAPVVAAAPAEKPSPRPANNQYMDTAELVADPVVTAAPRVNNQCIDTSELVAEPTPTPAPAKAAVTEKAAPVAAKTSKSSPSHYEDTADLVADPVVKPAKKAYVDTADLVAEPVSVAQSKPHVVDTADLVADPSPAKKAAPEMKQYEDTAELGAEPVPATPAPAPKAAARVKEYVDTADLVADAPVATPAPVPAPKKQHVDTAELFAEAPAPKPTPKPTPKQSARVVAKPVSAPAAPVPAPAPTPAPTPVVAPVEPKKKPTPAPVRSASSADTQDNFTIDEAAFYTVQWTEGPFGSTVREASSTNGPVMLITKRTGKHTCAGLRRIAVGDILVRIGDKDIPSMGFEKATRYLRKVPKPVPLTFQAID